MDDTQAKRVNIRIRHGYYIAVADLSFPEGLDAYEWQQLQQHFDSVRTLGPFGFAVLTECQEPLPQDVMQMFHIVCSEVYDVEAVGEFITQVILQSFHTWRSPLFVGMQSNEEIVAALALLALGQ